jgi:HAD superfamily hydrolase (TIGR01450 family)
VSDLDALPERYRLILCDLWGCVHDGYRLLPGALARLRRWQADGRTVLFVTNAPRTSRAIQAQLDRLKLPRDLYAGIVTAGEVGATALLGRPVGFCGTPADRADLEAFGLEFAESDFAELACAGLASGETVDDYRDALARWRADDLLLHCLNPDRVVIHGGERMVCAGALADAYEALGGRTCWYGKPYATTYDHALRLAGSPPKETVLAVGDGLRTDIAGAAAYGIGCVYVSGGVDQGTELPDGVGPLLVVPSL